MTTSQDLCDGSGFSPLKSFFFVWFNLKKNFFFGSTTRRLIYLFGRWMGSDGGNEKRWYSHSCRCSAIELVSAIEIDYALNGWVSRGEVALRSSWLSDWSTRTGLLLLSLLLKSLARFGYVGCKDQHFWFLFGQQKIIVLEFWSCCVFINSELGSLTVCLGWFLRWARLGSVPFAFVDHNLSFLGHRHKEPIANHA